MLTLIARTRLVLAITVVVASFQLGAPSLSPLNVNLNL